MTLSVDIVRSVLKEHVFPYHKLDKAQEERHIASVVSKFHWMNDVHFPETCKLVSETMAPGRLPVPAQYIGAYKAVQSSRSTGQPREQSQPESPEEAKGRMLGMIRKMSPEAAKRVYDSIDRGDPLAKLVKNWDGEVLNALIQKASLAKPDEPEPAKIVLDNKPPTVKPIKEVMEAALTAPAPEKKFEPEFF